MITCGPHCLGMSSKNSPTRRHTSSLGVDQTRLRHEFQRRQYRLTDVHGRVARDIVS